ncbi:MAG: hypothetical protein ABIJ74_04005 [archaeon]
MNEKDKDFIEMLQDRKNLFLLLWITVAAGIFGVFSGMSSALFSKLVQSELGYIITAISFIVEIIIMLYLGKISIKGLRLAYASEDRYRKILEAEEKASKRG